MGNRIDKNNKKGRGGKTKSTSVKVEEKGKKRSEGSAQVESRNEEKTPNSKAAKKSLKEDKQNKPSFFARLFGWRKKSDNSISEESLKIFRVKAQEILKKMEPNSDSDMGTVSAAKLMNILLSSLDSLYASYLEQKEKYERNIKDKEPNTVGNDDSNFSESVVEVTNERTNDVSSENPNIKESNNEETYRATIDLLTEEKNSLLEKYNSLEQQKSDLEVEIELLRENSIKSSETQSKESELNSDTSDSENEENYTEEPKAEKDESDKDKNNDDELEKLKKQLEEANAKVQDLEKTINENTKLLNEADVKLKGKAEIEAKLGTANNKVGVLESAKNGLEEKLNAAEGELSKVKGQLEAVEQEKTSLEKESQTLNQQIEALKSSDTGKLCLEIEELKKSHKDEVDAQRNEISNKQKEIDELRITISNNNEKITQLNDNIKELEEKLKELKEKIGDMDEEIKKSNSEISDLKTNRKLKEKEIERLHKEIKSLDEDIEEQKSVIKDNEKTIKSKVSEIKDLNLKITDLKSTVNNLEKTVEDKDKEIENGIKKFNLKEKELETSNTEILKSLDEAANAVNVSVDNVLALLTEGGYETGIGEMSDTCEEDENGMRRYFGRIVKSIRDIDHKSMRNIKEYRSAVTKIIESDLEEGMRGVILPMARTCAYGRLPFMRDNRGEDNMKLDGAKLSKIEAGLNTFLAHVGIELIVPVPFVDKIDEGDFEDGTGNVPNLDYICPNSRSHLDRVDRENLTDIVTDIISVGYRKDGKIVKAVVLK